MPKYVMLNADGRLDLTQSEEGDVASDTESCSGSPANRMTSNSGSTSSSVNYYILDPEMLLEIHVQARGMGNAIKEDQA